MINEHSAHLAPLSVDFRTWLWRYTYLLLLISMLWHRQAIFKSKGDKLSSSAESRVWTRDPWHLIASRLNACWQTDWVIEDQAKTWTWQPVPMISEHSAHLAPLSVDFRTWLWQYTYLLLLISMLWHRQAIFKSKGDKLSSSAEGRIWTRDSRHKIRQQTECSLTNIHTYIHTYLLLLISMLWHRQSIFKSRGDKLSSSAEGRIWTWDPRHLVASRLNVCWQTDLAIKDQAKTLIRQPLPIISEHSAHLAPLSVDFRYIHTCLLLSISMLLHRQAIFKSKGDKLCSSAESRIWTRDPSYQFSSRLNARWQTYIHTYLLLLISMLWHRQSIFKSKGDKLSSSAEGRIWTWNPRHLVASRLNARWQTDLAIKDQAKTWIRQPSLWSASIQPTWPHCQLTFAPGSGNIHICCC